MTADEAAVAVMDALDRSAIPFMIVGSLASNFHGIPRATRDADFLIQIGSASVADLAAALPAGLRLESQASFETVTGTIRYLVTLDRSPFANRSKDRDDVRNIIAVRGSELDWFYIERWCDAHGTLGLLGDIRDSIPAS